jgi:serine/threonine protein kinase
MESSRYDLIGKLTKLEFFVFLASTSIFLIPCECRLSYISMRKVMNNTFWKPRVSCACVDCIWLTEVRAPHFLAYPNSNSIIFILTHVPVDVLRVRRNLRSRGLIHLDGKPENLLVEGDTVTVIDGGNCRKDSTPRNRSRPKSFFRCLLAGSSLVF